jgi:hypothetical protein
MICIEESRYHNNLQEDTSLDGYRVITLLKFMEGAFTPFVGHLVRILTDLFFQFCDIVKVAIMHKTNEPSLAINKI